MSNAGLIGILICAIVFIIFAITKLRLHAFLALSFASVFVALASGVPLSNIGNILESGVGGTLGFLAIIIGSGAIGCTIVTDSLFWLVKENLGLSMKEVFKYFSGATFIASLAGLLLSLVLSHFT